MCECKYASATLLCRIAFSLVPVDRHRWACFFWLVARTNARGCSSGCYMHCDRVVSDVLVFFVYVFDKERFVHICFITTGLSAQMWLRCGQQPHLKMWAYTLSALWAREARDGHPVIHPVRHQGGESEYMTICTRASKNATKGARGPSVQMQWVCTCNNCWFYFNTLIVDC